MVMPVQPLYGFIKIYLIYPEGAVDVYRLTKSGDKKKPVKSNELPGPE